MAIVQGLLRRQSISGAVNEQTSRQDPDNAQLKGPYPILLQAAWVPQAAPVYLLVPGGDTTKVKPRPGYETPFVWPNPRIFQPPLPSVQNFQQNVNDSVTPTDQITTFSVLWTYPFPMVPKSVQGILSTYPSYDCKYPNKAQIFVRLPVDISQNISDSVTPSDSLAFDVGMEIDDTVSVADLLTPNLTTFIPGLLTKPRDYLAPQVRGPYGTLLNGLNISAPQWFIDDTVSVSDAIAKDIGMEIDDSVTTSDNFSSVGGSSAPNPLVFLTKPRDYLAPQIRGPYGVILTGQFVGAVTGVNFGQAFADSVSVDDTAYIDRQPNVDDDVLSMSDNIVLNIGYGISLSENLSLADNIVPVKNIQFSQVITDSVFLTDNSSFINTGSLNQTYSQDDAVTVTDEVTLSLGNLHPLQPGVLVPSKPGPLMDIR